MKKLLAVLVLAVSCFSSWAVDLPVPEELVGAQTIGIAHVHLKALKFDQITKTLTEKLGAAPDVEGTAKMKEFVDKFVAAGGQGITILVNSSKDADPAKAADNVVFLVNKGEEANTEKIVELFAPLLAGAKDKLAPECPKEIGHTLAWYSAKYKAPKANEDRGAAFGTAYEHLAKDSTVSIVIVPDEEAVELAEKSLGDAKPEEAKMAKALLGATGFCIFTDFGVAADPALKVLVLAADADGAVVLDKAATGLINGFKKEAPPPLLPVLNSLVSAQVGANVQLSINISDLVKAITALSGGEAPPAK